MLKMLLPERILSMCALSQDRCSKLLYEETNSEHVSALSYSPWAFCSGRAHSVCRPNLRFTM